MAVARTPRAAWIEAGLRALSAGGPDAVRVESLAQALGVSKGGFYWHFGDRAALLTEMLDAWESEVTAEVIRRTESGGGDARTRLRRLFGTAVEGLVTDVTTDLAIRDWARRDEAVAERLRRTDTTRMDYLRSLFLEAGAGADEAEARSMIAFSVWIGDHLIRADHGPHSRARVLQLAFQQLMR
ncbi:helix-turn-helix domain-containing protein [Spirillospora sp. NPDC047279]|uniref:TetR/AcrR family transcriptional regulator n=1 Tax=Spirillospora sp. NPDC047279 TaxID=3155478 RepID=UPI0033F9BD81